MNKKGPDKYRTVKCSLKRIIKDDNDIASIHDVMMRTHKLSIHASQFLRLWLLDKYHNQKDLPIITEDTIIMAYKSLRDKCRGPKPKGANLKLLNDFNNFYTSHYQKLGLENKIDGTNLPHILIDMATEMLTNIENNVKLHFVKYLNRFVNASFKMEHRQQIEDTPKGYKIHVRKQLNLDLHAIKQDFLNNTLLSSQRYHEWIETHRQFILPKITHAFHDIEIQTNPQHYLPAMIYMCLELEKLGVKSFQFFPLRTDIVPKYIPLDTTTLIELFYSDQNTYLHNIERYKREVWREIFKLDNNIFKQKDYQFDYRISTDCVGVSIQLIHTSFIENEKNKKANRKRKKNDNKELYKTMTQEEKEAHKQEVVTIQKEKELDDKLAYRETHQGKPKIKKVEFPYLEDLNKDQLDELREGNWIVADPGKRCLLYMRNKDGKKFTYTNGKHMMRTKRLKYQKMNQHYRDREGISKIERKLSGYSSKTCQFDLFKEFIKHKNDINEQLFEQYSNERFRRYKWYGYINRKRAETDLVRDIKQKYGKDTIMIIGDWGAKGKVKYISTPNLGLKRKLAEQLTVYNLDEFRTSCLHHETLEKCENLHLPDKKGVMQKKHSILTYQMENQRLGCIDRDNNASRNMVNLVYHFLQFQTRPLFFQRSYKFPEKVTTSLKSNVTMSPLNQQVGGCD
jgi:hypothetical protein